MSSTHRTAVLMTLAITTFSAVCCSHSGAQDLRKPRDIIADTTPVATQEVPPSGKNLTLDQISPEIPTLTLTPPIRLVSQANPAPSAASTGSQKPANSPTPQSATSTETPEVVRQRRRAELGLDRPMTAISLTATNQLLTEAGAVLKVPQDKVQEISASLPQYHDHTLHAGTPRPVRNGTAICYNPLYFEDPNLERCGKGCGILTEGVSAVRFFGRIPLIPYMVGANPPCRCVRALPDCPVCHEFGHDAYLPPLDAHGTALQAAATVGLIFLIP